jgi:RNA polymerase sigma-70 factor (ECF subfamily)
MIPDSEIAEGLKLGSSQAFRALYDAYGSAVLAYLTRVTGRKEMAEELTQETFLTAIRKIGFFKAGPDGGLKAWMFRIATHGAIDVLRREKRMTGLPVDWEERPSPDSPHSEMERMESSEALQAALNRLTAAQRMVFLLKEQEGMSLLEISRVCGASENAIKQGLFRARAALKRYLPEEVEP